MEERLGRSDDSQARRPSMIPRRPVGLSTSKSTAVVVPGPYAAPPRPLFEGNPASGSSSQQSPNDIPPRETRSPAPPIPPYSPYRKSVGPADVGGTFSGPYEYVPYRRVSGDRIRRRSTVNRGSLNRSSVVSRPSVRRSTFTNDEVSPITPSSTHFPSVQSDIRRPSINEVLSSINREVSQYHSSDGGEHHPPLSPLMELSAHEAVHRSNVSISASTVGSIVRDRVGTLIHSGRQRIIRQSVAGHEATYDWLPRALRLPFLATAFMLCLGLGGAVLALTVVSNKRNGLGLDQGSAGFLSAWRFVPTILAVIYTLFTMAIVKDIKRTEAYARLSRSEGASAASSLFLKFRPCWYEPFDAIRRSRNEGNRNWALFWASFANFLGLLVITPFSASLLSPTGLTITTPTTFSRVASWVDSPIEPIVDDSILFRTTADVLLDSTTSIWLNGDYAVLPFWPADSVEPPLSGSISNSDDEWTAETTVYQAALDCLPMTLQDFTNFTVTRRVPAEPATLQVYDIFNMTSFELESVDGCSLGFAASGFTPDGIFQTGGGYWSDSTQNFTYPSLWNPGNGTFEDVDNQHPVLINSSSECGNRNMFFVATPGIPGEKFQAEGQICTTTYYSADITVTMNNVDSSSAFSFDTDQFDQVKTPISASILDTRTLERNFITPDWDTKFRTPDADANSSTSNSGMSRFGGPLGLVAALNSNNPQAMLANTDLPDQARQVKQIFLGESLQATFRQIGATKADTVDGTIIANQRKIVVSLPVGIVLTVVLFVSALMIGLVVGYTRLHERPLNISQDPDSIEAKTMLITNGQNTRALFEGLDTTSREYMIQQLSKYRFYLRSGILYSYDVRDVYQLSGSSQSDTTHNSFIEAQSNKWRPKILQAWSLGLLIFSAAAIVAAIATLFVLFRYSGIINRRFSVDDIGNLDNTPLAELAPYSLVPTLFAILIRIWWDSIDHTCRRFPPSLSMAHGAVRSKKGLGMNYIRSTSIGAALKALKNSHFVLMLVVFTAIIVEVLIVGMSGLWNLSVVVETHNSMGERDMALRTAPIIFTVPLPSTSTPETAVVDQNADGVLNNVFSNSLTRWLYAAAVESSFNVTTIPWAKHDWSFVPLNLSVARSSVDAASTGNVTVDTPSVRGRLQCSSIDMSNTSAWLSTLDFTRKSNWNDASIPSDLNTGYELKVGLSLNQSLDNGSYHYWDDENPYFSFFAADYRMECCGNETDDTVGETAIGYWSPAGDSKHTSVIVKWITGHAFKNQFKDANNQLHWVWKDIPSVNALNCTPVFETSNARVDVELSSGRVQEYQINAITIENNAWLSEYQSLNGSNPSDASLQSVDVSYGYLFHDILLRASDVARIGNFSTDSNTTENLSDRTFNFRQPGLNVDYMSYSSLAMVQHDKSALLDPQTLSDVSSTVFSIFFKHFVQSPVTSNNGLSITDSWLLSSTASQETMVVVSEEVEKLSFIPTAVILCLCILSFLIVVTATVFFWQHKYLKALPRDVDSLGSILGFVYGSERLLRKVADDDTIHEKLPTSDVATMGWFNNDGKQRWGIELVDEDQAKREKVAAQSPPVPQRPESSVYRPGDITRRVSFAVHSDYYGSSPASPISPILAPSRARRSDIV